MKEDVESDKQTREAHKPMSRDDDVEACCH